MGPGGGSARTCSATEAIVVRTAVSCCQDTGDFLRSRCGRGMKHFRRIQGCPHPFCVRVVGEATAIARYVQ